MKCQIVRKYSSDTYTKPCDGVENEIECLSVWFEAGVKCIKIKWKSGTTERFVETL